jgi:hypothetical protein
MPESTEQRAESWLAVVTAELAPVAEPVTAGIVEPGDAAALDAVRPAPAPPNPALAGLLRQFVDAVSVLLAEQRRREEVTGIPWQVRLQPVVTNPHGITEVQFSVVLEPADLAGLAQFAEEAR